MSLSSLLGIPIYTSTIIPEFNTMPVKKHVLKSTGKKSYHLRIQKKWNKRFGFKKERYIYCADGKYIVHPNTLLQLKISKNAITGSQILPEDMQCPQKL